MIQKVCGGGVGRWVVLEAHFINLFKTKPKVLLLARTQAEQKGDKRTNGRTSELSENVTS